MAIRWSPPDVGSPVPTERPPKNDRNDDRHRAALAATTPAFRALARDPSATRGQLFRPVPEQMEVAVARLEGAYGGRLVFATTDFHDQWLILRPDGSWLEVQREDGLHAEYPTTLHLAVELLIRAKEDEPYIPQGALVKYSQALGLPGSAVSVIQRSSAGGLPQGGAYEAWKARVTEELAGQV